MSRFVSAPRRVMGALALAAALGLAGSPALAKVLAKVDGVEITDEDMRLAIEDVGPGLPQQLQGKARDGYLMDYLIDSKLVAKKAEAEKLADTPEFKKRLEFMREKALMETELSRIAKTAATEDAIKKTYEEAKAKQKPEDEVRAKHILVEKEDEAKNVVKRLKAGEDFAKVAKEVSKDPGSEGGDLGWFSKERMVPEFSDAAFKLAPGQLSDPVKSQFGWHVIKVEEKRQKPFPTLEQVKDQVLRYVVQKAQSEVVLKLREGAKIERMEGAPAPALAPPAAKPETDKK
jgi:peptidyl-prolyl cis-trans isomerase C